MTDRQQKAFYFPLWNQVARTNDWIMVKGKLLAQREPRFGREEANALYQRVWEAAELLAQAAHRAVTADDLRHACHVVALATQSKSEKSQVPIVISSKNLTNKQLDRVAALFKILIEPDDIDAWLNWDNPAKADKKRLIHSIKALAPEAYICKVVERWPGFTWPFWEDLELPQLINLRRILSNRTDHGRTPLGSPGSAPAEATSNNPF